MSININILAQCLAQNCKRWENSFKFKWERSLNNKVTNCWAWSHMPLILVLGKQRWTDLCESKTILVCIPSPGPYNTA